jgi:hypothetical protein
VGGTGAAAAKHVKARMQEIVGGEQPYLAIRAFDTDVQGDDRPYLVDGTEYIYLGGFNAQAVISDIDPDGVHSPSRRAYPHWGKWLSPRLSHQQVAVGAGGIRPIGRLCYFYRREQIREAVQDALQHITDPGRALELEKEQGLHVAPGIVIHLCCSVCGGTGSGMFLDLAFDLRRWAAMHTSADVSVIGHLVLPEAFRGKPVVDRALQANSYIALQELDHFMNARPDAPWEAEYHAGEPERSPRAPFDTCYLLSAGQHGTLEIEDLTAAMGESVVLLTAFDAGHVILKGETNTANQSKAKIDTFGRSCCYSSYGVIGVDVPRELIAQHLVDRVRRVVARQAGDSGPSEYAEWMRTEVGEHTARLEAAFMERRFDVRKVPIQVEAARSSWGRAQDRRAAAKRGRPALFGGDNGGNVQAETLEADARGKFQQALGDAAREVDDRVEKALSEPMVDADAWLEGARGHLRTLLGEARGGRLTDAVRYLTLLGEELQRLHDEISSRISKANQQQDKHTSDVEELGRGGPASDRWWDVVDRAIYDSWYPYQQAGIDAKLLARYRDKVKEQRDPLDRWAQRLQSLISSIRDPRPTATSEEAYNDSHRGRSAVVPIRALVSDYSADGASRGLLDDVAAQIGPQIVVSIATDRKWLDGPDDRSSIEQTCTAMVVEHLRTATGYDCESLLEQSAGDTEEFERRMFSFWDRARPAWSLSETYTMRTNALEISAVGAVRGSRMFDVLLKRDRRVQATSSQCPDYVPILCTQHGVSLLGLRTLPEYRKAFLEAVQHDQRFDFHFFLDTRWVTEIEFPDEPTEELEWLGMFSLAVDLEIIARDENKAYHFNDMSAPRRWQMFAILRPEHFRALHSLVEEKLMMGAGKPSGGMGDPVRTKLMVILAYLINRVSRARRTRRDRTSTEAEVNLSRDLFQLHREIRGCRYLLRPTDIHPEDEPPETGHGF